MIPLRYHVRLFIKGLPNEAFLVETTQQAMCHFHTIAVSSLEREDLLYFIVYAWMADPNLLLKKVMFSVNRCRATTPPVARAAGRLRRERQRQPMGFVGHPTPCGPAVPGADPSQLPRLLPVS